MTVSLTFVGCGRPAYELDTAPVTGLVTIDGQPLPSGYVFVSTERGRMAKGLIQPDGTFVLSTYRDGDGAQAGIHAVTIAPVPSDDPSFNPGMKHVAIPERYSNARPSGLTIEVKPDTENNAELKLSSTRGSR